MESVQERMERLGTKEKMASFIQKEKHINSSGGMHRSGRKNSPGNAMGVV